MILLRASLVKLFPTPGGVDKFPFSEIKSQVVVSFQGEKYGNECFI